MPDKLRISLKRPLFRYLAGSGAVGLAFLLREMLSSAVGPDFPEYVVFYPTVMIVALLAGLWPGLLAIVTTAGLILLFWLIPGHAPLLHVGTSNFVGLGLFMVVCGFLTAVAELYRRSRQKAAVYDKEQAQRETQEALRQQAELLKLSFDAIIIRRSGAGIESWNRGAEELYGFPEKEARGKSLNELLQSHGAGRLQEVEETLRSRGEWFGEIRHTRKDGKAVIVSSRQLLGRGMDGSERVLQIDRDVTHRTLIEQELRRAHDELEEKVKQRTAELAGANRTLLMVSAADQALVQISDEKELIGVICQIIQDEGRYPLVWVGLVHGDEGGLLRSAASAGDRDGYIESLEAAGGVAAHSSGPAGRAIRSKSPEVCHNIEDSFEEARWKREATSRGFRTVAALPLLDPQMGAIGVLVIHSDVFPNFDQKQVTLLKELADDLAFGIISLRARAERDQAQKSLERKATQLKGLAAEIVRTEQRERQRIARLLHDQVQQLLVATLYGLEGLHDVKPRDDFLQSVTKLSGMMRECIGISRTLVSELSHPSYMEPDLCTALGWLGTWMKEKHGLDVRVHCSEAITAEGEETRITLLESVRELLFNVVKHAHVKEASVDLERSADGNARITVRDDGVGFDQGASSAHGIAPSGIGLFSVRERLDVIGGGLNIESSVGKGCRVTVWVPVSALQRPHGASAQEGAREESSSHLEAIREPRLSSARAERPGKIRVLLVDDHAVVRDGIALQLRQHPDIEIVGEAPDGAQALKLVHSLRPDVVTMDVNMPGMNGIEATRAIHAVQPSIRIIGLSIAEDSEQGAAMRNAGALHYLSKSASLDALLDAIRDVAHNE